MCVYTIQVCVCMREHTINTVNRLLDNTMNHRYEQLWVHSLLPWEGEYDALLIGRCVQINGDGELLHKCRPFHPKEWLASSGRYQFVLSRR